MAYTKDELLALVREAGSEMTLRQKLRLTVLLAIPAIIAHISLIAMQMIDAAMLGHLSTIKASAVGLVSTTIWLYGGLTGAFAAGFSVQVAHRIGAGDNKGARSVIRQGLFSGLIFASLLGLSGIIIAPHLPHWLGAQEVICHDATRYFTIFSYGLPFVTINNVAAGCLRCSGNIKVPSILMVIMCCLDVFFNYVFIYRMDMGTDGAALGTLVAYAITVIFMVGYMTLKDKLLNFRQDDRLDFIPKLKILKKTCRIGLPIGLERSIMCTAQITISSIIAPLGSIAIAANSFAINVESLCYMPGYGVAEASTTLVAQSKGASKRNLMHSFAWICMALGVGIMAIMGFIMWVFAPEMMSLISPDKSVIDLGTEILRIEAWAEPGFAAAIVAMSVFVGAGKTLIPSLMNLGSIWIVRVSLTLLLAPTMGLRGVWIAMAIELCFRGIIFTARLCTRKWSFIKDRSKK
jgi:putative MATE family efflux protein